MAFSTLALRCRAMGWKQRARVSLHAGHLRFGPAHCSNAIRRLHGGVRNVAAAYQPNDASALSDSAAPVQLGLSTLELFQEVRRRQRRQNCQMSVQSCS